MTDQEGPRQHIPFATASWEELRREAVRVLTEARTTHRDIMRRWAHANAIVESVIPVKDIGAMAAAAEAAYADLRERYAYDPALVEHIIGTAPAPSPPPPPPPRTATGWHCEVCREYGPVGFGFRPCGEGS